MNLKNWYSILVPYSNMRINAAKSSSTYLKLTLSGNSCCIQSRKSLPVNSIQSGNSIALYAGLIYKSLKPKNSITPRSRIKNSRAKNFLTPLLVMNLIILFSTSFNL